MEAPRPEMYDLACAACARSLSVSLTELATRGTCRYCGGRIDLPAEVARLVVEARERARPRPPVRTTCPICDHSTGAPAEQAGQTVGCVFCGCKIVVPASDGPALPARIGEPVPALTGEETLSATCPGCGAMELRPLGPEGWRAACAKCSREVDCLDLPLDAFMDLPQVPKPASTPEIAAEALRQRWRQRDVGLAEAMKLYFSFSEIERWTRTGTPLTSPLDPKTTAEVARAGVLGFDLGQAQVTRRGEGYLVDIVIRGREIVLSSFWEWEGMTAPDGTTPGPVAVGAASGLIAAGVAGAVLFPELGGVFLDAASLGGGFVEPGDSVETRRIDASILLAFLGVPGGTEMAIGFRDSKGKVCAAEERLVTRIREAFRIGMAPALRRYLALRSVFGIWAPAALVFSVAERAIARRLKHLGGPLAANAAMKAKALMERPDPFGGDPGNLVKGIY